jgi:hypothetical protein
MENINIDSCIKEHLKMRSTVCMCNIRETKDSSYGSWLRLFTIFFPQKNNLVEFLRVSKTNFNFSSFYRILFRTMKFEYDFVFDWTMLKQGVSSSDATTSKVPQASPVQPSTHAETLGTATNHTNTINFP